MTAPDGQEPETDGGERQEPAKRDRDWLVWVEFGSPGDGAHRVTARSASAARYASFKAWIDVGYGSRFHSKHEAFVYFSRNYVVRVERALELGR